MLMCTYIGEEDRAKRLAVATPNVNNSLQASSPHLCRHDTSLNATLKTHTLRFLLNRPRPLAFQSPRTHASNPAPPPLPSSPLNFPHSTASVVGACGMRLRGVREEGGNSGSRFQTRTSFESAGMSIVSASSRDAPIATSD